MTRYPLDASVWFRDSTQEWVLEISGTIRDTHLIIHHAQPATTKPEDVPGLPTRYTLDAARWFASGPQGEFFAPSCTFAEALIAAAGFDRDDWTITDLENPEG